jgi:hypothetical protein
MKKINPPPTLEEELLHLKQKAEKGAISIEELLHILPGKGLALIAIILSLPFCQPVQILGMSTPFGLCIGFIGLRMAFGRHAWLPNRLLKLSISPSIMEKIVDKTLWLINKMKRWIHPRLGFLSYYPPIHLMNGLLISFLGLILALPLPIPFSNITSAWAIFLISLGMLEDDGLFIIGGYLVSLLTLAFFVGIYFSIELAI